MVSWYHWYNLIRYENPSVITFTLITSFPLFCMTLIPRLPSDNQPTLIMEAIGQLRILTDHSNSLISDISWALYLPVQLLKVYLVDLVNFFAALTTIYAASTVYTSRERSIMSLRDLLRNSITKTRWKEPIVTFLSVSLSNSLCLGAVHYWNERSRLLSSSY